jgi:hypothetical protein
MSRRFLKGQRLSQDMTACRERVLAGALRVGVRSNQERAPLERHTGGRPAIGALACGSWHNAFTLAMQSRAAQTSTS